MKHQTATFLKSISLIQRNTNRYFDTMLEEFQIGSGQQFFLLRIFEHDGITLYDLAKTGGYDKGTATKAVQKLVDQGYVECVMDERDKRVRHLHITPSGMPVIERLYEIRACWKSTLLDGMTNEQEEELLKLLEQIAKASSHTLCEIGGKKEHKRQ
ncbi:MAG: MarR family transcriptional regulator [Firmicutes bacterium]|uniref:MarR family transcriptional regulator n=1 Tax=Candidatus Scybalomonas excrementavium TaxID=2840943 RepID=A0A9D9N868_9FIRM|nr:MarR family transcriptional regulator [Candidatus Scybalomonas excrementavium]